MKGLFFTGDRRAELRELDPEEPGPGQVLVAIRASGICGSDLGTYRLTSGELERSGRAGVVAGHEPAGVVEEVGPGVGGFRRGDRVLAHHIVGCGACAHCRSGHPVSCASPARDAYGARRNGGHATYMLAEAWTLIPIPDGATFVDGAMTACGLATAFSALRKAGVSGRDRVLVTGLGPVGLGVLLLAGALGAEVIGVDPNPERRELARSVGAAAVLGGGGDAAAELRDITGGGPEVVVECSGADAARSLCLEAARPFGTVVLVGFGEHDLHVDAGRLITGQLTVRGSWVASVAEMEETVAFLSRRDVHGDALVTQRVTLEGAPGAYASFDAGAAGKHIVTFGPADR